MESLKNLHSWGILDIIVDWCFEEILDEFVKEFPEYFLEKKLGRIHDEIPLRNSFKDYGRFVQNFWKNFYKHYSKNASKGLCWKTKDVVLRQKLQYFLGILRLIFLDLSRIFQAFLQEFFRRFFHKLYRISPRIFPDFLKNTLKEFFRDFFQNFIYIQGWFWLFIR